MDAVIGSRISLIKTSYVDEIFTKYKKIHEEY